MIPDEEKELAVDRALRTRDGELLDWLQDQFTLHRGVDVVYVVDGYRVALTRDGDAIGEPAYGATLREALWKAKRARG